MHRVEAKCCSLVRPELSVKLFVKIYFFVGNRFCSVCLSCFAQQTLAWQSVGSEPGLRQNVSCVLLPAPRTSTRVDPSSSMHVLLECTRCLVDSDHHVRVWLNLRRCVRRGETAKISLAPQISHCILRLFQAFTRAHASRQKNKKIRDITDMLAYRYWSRHST